MIAITRNVIASRRQMLDLVDRQLTDGAASQLDVARTRAQLEDARANLPGLESGFNNAVFAIATLLAEPSRPILSELTRWRLAALSRFDWHPKLSMDWWPYRSAVQYDAQGSAFVYLANSMDQLTWTEVTVGSVVGDIAVLSDGVAPGDSVILSRPQPAVEGMTVTPIVARGN